MAERASRGEVEDALEVAQHATVTSRYPLVGILAAEVRALREDKVCLEVQLAGCSGRALMVLESKNEIIAKLQETLARVEGLVEAWQDPQHSDNVHEYAAYLERAKDLEKALKGES